MRRLVCKRRRKRLEAGQEEEEAGDRAGGTAGAASAHHIDLGVGVAHVAHDAAVLHPVQVLPGHHILVPCRHRGHS